MKHLRIMIGLFTLLNVARGVLLFLKLVSLMKNTASGPGSAYPSTYVLDASIVRFWTTLLVVYFVATATVLLLGLSRDKAVRPVIYVTMGLMFVVDFFAFFFS